MQPASLVCAVCGAPLPPPSAISPLLACEYCRATAELTSPVSPGLAPRRQVPSERQRALNDAVSAFVAAVDGALTSGRSAEDAIRTAAQAHLGALGQGDGLARVAVAIAADFDRANGTATLRDPGALARIVQGYLTALTTLAVAGEAEISFPFLGVGPSGPAHLALRLTPASLSELARRGASPAISEQAPLVAAPSASLPKKKGWWPF